MVLFFPEPCLAECACAYLMDHWWLYWFTSSSVFPFIHRVVYGLGLMLLTRILLVCVDISMPYPATVFFSLSVSQQIDVDSKAQVAKQSSSDGHRREWNASFFYCITCKAVFF